MFNFHAVRPPETNCHACRFCPLYTRASLRPRGEANVAVGWRTVRYQPGSLWKWTQGIPPRCASRLTSGAAVCVPPALFRRRYPAYLCCPSVDFAPCNAAGMLQRVRTPEATTLANATIGHFVNVPPLPYTHTKKVVLFTFYSREDNREA